MYILLFSMVASAAAPIANPCAPREDPLAEAIAALAGQVLSIRNMHVPLRLDWRNESSLPAAQSAALLEEFSAQLAGAGALLTEDPSAPPLRVTLCDTATELLAIARIPAADGEQIRFVQASRAAFAPAGTRTAAPSLQKQLLWKQREPIVYAVEHSLGGTTVLLVLGRETLWVYAPAQTEVELRALARIPGPVRPSRALAGRIDFPKVEEAHFRLELPGRACSGTLAEKIALDCTVMSDAKRSPGNPNSARLLAPCDHSAWTLSSDDGDWSRPDRLFLQDMRNAADRTAVLEAPGPVLSLAATPDSASSTAVVQNLATGEYEVHRFTLACHN